MRLGTAPWGVTKDWGKTGCTPLAREAGWGAGAGDERAVLGEPPLLRQAGAELLVVHPLHELALELDEAAVAALGGLAGLAELVGEALEGDEDADVVDHPGEERLVGHRQLH